jgi:hypothetical protein
MVHTVVLLQCLGGFETWGWLSDVAETCRLYSVFTIIYWRVVLDGYTHLNTVSTCFEHYLLIFRKCCINNTWYTARVLCRLAATRVGVPLYNKHCNKLNTTNASLWSYYTDIQDVSRLMDITAGDNFLGLCDQKSSYKHVSDFGRLRSYDRLKIRREGDDYWQ